MDYARHYVEGSQKVDGGGTMRDYWLASGSDVALAKLVAPEFPEELSYLWEWTLELHGRSGANMAGLNPLSYEAIDAWGRLTGRDPMPHEVEGLILLDAALRPGTRDEVGEDAEEKPVSVWPESKNA